MRSNILGAGKTDAPVESLPKEDLRQVPYALPKGFCWRVMNLGKTEEILKTVEFLSKHYVSSGNIRPFYSADLLRWSTGWGHSYKDWTFGVVAEGSGKIMAFISGRPEKITLDSKMTPVVTVSFLTVHKKLRGKRLAPVMIKEIVRRASLSSWCNSPCQAVYCLSKKILPPLTTVTLWIRLLDPKYLRRVGYLQTGTEQFPTETKLRLFSRKVDEVDFPYRAVTHADLPRVKTLLDDRMKAKKIRLRPHFTIEDCKIHFLPDLEEPIVFSFISEDGDSFGSFYCHTLRIDGEEILSAILTYCVSPDLTRWLNKILCVAQDLGVHLFQAPDAMGYTCAFERLRFVKGSSKMHYYLYNWNHGDIDRSECGKILI